MSNLDSLAAKCLRSRKALVRLPVAAAIVGVLLLVWWLTSKPDLHLALRVPGTDRASSSDGTNSANAVLAGQRILGTGVASDLPGSWTGFRGGERDGVSREAIPLAKSWDQAGPRELWAIDVGEGYAGAAVSGGRVYIMDYDRDKKQDALRCLSLGDGQEIWRFVYPMAVKRNHGMSRTMPTLTTQEIVAMGPKCHVVCLDAITGELKWGLDLVRQFGTTVPPWYAGQCPLVDKNTVVLAPGGPDALLLGVAAGTGKVLWQTPNPKGWKMTHSSAVPMDFAGRHFYVYCASLGVVGVSAADGSMLWDTTDWKISIATVPSPVILEDGRIFLSGGYNAGSLMLQLTEVQGRIVPKVMFRIEPEVFGATQQTPVYYEKHLYGVRADGQFTCLDAEGKVAWTSGPSQTFGLGSFLLADGALFALNDSGTLSLIEATPAKYNLLARAQVLKGHESWGPMTLAGSRLIVRDLTRMVCLDVSRR